ncbi:MAG: outer membrane beta-barrel protein [Bdellovibrionales bacterium]|jgi:outer membrane protein OmpA-like peptidoglycan-associated protein
MISLRTMSLAVATLAILAPLSAQAATPTGWYVGGNTNLSYQTDADSKLSGVTDVFSYKTGWGLSGDAGYAWGNGIRTEAELLYRHSQVENVTGTGAGTAGGGIHNKALMGNVFYDFNTGTRLTPYLGAGVGTSLVDADAMRTVNGATLDDNDRVAFAYQGIAGFALALEGNWDFTADYRYFATPDVKFKTSAGVRAETENASHNLMMGIRYTFAQPKAKAEPMAETPAPAPAPVVASSKATPPVVAPVPQSYMVFFDFDKSVLTPEALRIIASAAEDYKKGGYVRLVVTGHTDTMGTAKYNQKLSERRAAAVKAEFIRLGVPAEGLMASGAGKGNLLVPTADHVREAQNRRAEIVMKK